MLPKIKIMRDYQCYPIWIDDFEHFTNLNPAEIPLSKNLVQRLSAWSELYEKNVNLIDPFDVFNVSLKSELEERAEELEGLEIWLAVRNELKEKYDVIYVLEGKLLLDPKEHPLFLQGR